MVEKAFSDNIAHLLTLWHCYGNVTTNNELYIHEKWPNKVWSRGETIDESEVVLKANRANTPNKRKYVTFTTKKPTDASSSLVAMSKSITNEKDIPEDNSICQVMNELELREWVKVGSQGFGYDIDIASIKSAFLDNRSSFYFIKHNNDILGTVMAWRVGKDVGIHQMTVLPQGRGKGLATKALIQLERHARLKKAHTMSLQASKKGLSIYKKIGFKPLGYVSSYL
jgi:GNAT superfamily N-acetyltransferase